MRDISQYYRDLLSSNNERKIAWVEPRPGMLENGVVVDCRVTHYMSPQDCVATERHRLQNTFRDIESWQILADFMAVHWAQVIK